MLTSILSIVLKVVCWTALIAFVVWFGWALYRTIFKPGKNGKLPWL